MLNLLLKDIAIKGNFCAQSHATLRDLIKLMFINQKGATVILKDERPVGILTEKDIVEILYRGIDLDERADKYARKTLITTRENRTIGYTLNLMIENNIRRIIVTDNSDNFICILTQQDLLKQLEDDYYRSTLKIKHISEELRYLISIPIECTLNEALEVMVENQVSAVPIKKDGEAVGIVTEKDILKLAAKNISLENHVSKYMSKPLISTKLDTDIVDTVKIMNHHNIRRVVVTNNEGIAVTVITIRDLFRNLKQDYSTFLERKLRHAKDVLNLLPEMLIEVTDTGHEQLIIWANEKVISRFGKELLGKPVTNFLSRENWNKVYTTLNQLNKIENIRVKKDNKIYELSGFFIKTDYDMEKGRIQLIMRDITEDIKLSTTDPLTGVYNRRLVNEFLAKELERCKRLNKYFSLAICDLDGFKEINDSYGHLNGDVILQSFSQTIAKTIRQLDVVGRYGGDEFVLILPETTNKDASEVINRIRKKIERKKIPLPQNVRLSITASFGVSTFPEDGESADDLIIKADERLYKAKNLGKNMVVFT